MEHGSPLDDQSQSGAESETKEKVLFGRLEDPDSDYVADSDSDMDSDGGSEGPHSQAGMEKKPILNASPRDPAIVNEAATQEETKVYPCKICGREYTKQGSLRGHLFRIHPKPKGSEKNDFPFDIVPQSIPSGRAEPQPIIDPESDMYLCDRCPKSFDERRQWLNHYKKSHLVKFRCTLCDKIFARKGECKSHHQITHQGIKRFHCPKCNRRFTNKFNLGKHQRNNHCKGPPEKPKCSYCQKEFTEAGNMRQHVKSVHLKVRDLTCPHCGKGFSENKTLQIHLKGVHSESGVTNYLKPRKVKKSEDVPEPGVVWVARGALEPMEIDPTSGEGPDKQTWKPPPLVFNQDSGKYRCDHCPLEFTFPQNFHRHYWKITHRPIWNCRVCQKEFKKRNAYTCHYKAAHSGISLSCPNPNCEKSFTRKGSLRAHLRLTGCGGGGGEGSPQVKQECPTCGKTFLYESLLQYHVKAVHLNVRDHLCNQCGKSFAGKNNLQRHVERLHPEGDEQVCEVCGKGFKAKENLRRHCRKMHNIYYKRC